MTIVTVSRVPDERQRRLAERHPRGRMPVTSSVTRSTTRPRLDHRRSEDRAPSTGVAGEVREC
jgi:hypothetical protein